MPAILYRSVNLFTSLRFTGRGGRLSLRFFVPKALAMLKALLGLAIFGSGDRETVQEYHRETVERYARAVGRRAVVKLELFE